MTGVFLRILSMSITGGAVILIILAARPFFRRAPRIFSYLLWSAALFRLLCPAELPGMFSLLPLNAQPVSEAGLLGEMPKVNTGIALLDRPVNSLLPGPELGASVNPMQVWAAVGSFIWIVGAAGLMICGLISLLRLSRRLKTARPEGDGVMAAEKICTAFVLGVFRPKIYLPASLKEEEREKILLHERTHIRRLDHIWRLAAFLALCIHWFNPLCWAAFILSGKDMEMSCDEAVIRRMGEGEKKTYAESLLNLSSRQRLPEGTSLAFGKGEVKERVKNVLRFRKPAFWTVLAAAFAAAVLISGLVFSGGRAEDVSIAFPAYQDGKNEYNAGIYEREPFSVSMELPDGWSISLPEKEKRGPGTPWTPVTILDSAGKAAGFAGFGVFEEVPELPQEEYWKAVYSEIRLSNLMSWCQEYTPVRADEEGEAAVCKVYVSEMLLSPEKYESAAEAGTVEFPAITAYDKEKGVYFAACFEAESLTPEEQKKAAESIRFSGK